MIHGSYLLSVVIATVLGWSSWAVVINKLSPFSSTPIALSLFYTSIILALTGTFTLINYYIRISLNKGEIYNVQFNTSLRQGFLLAAMVALALAFQRLKVLTWWDGLLLLAIVLLIEFYFMARE